MKNHLKNQTSPYLLQHSESPVNWYPWCKEAFEKAKQEDKPIFLSIGYSTCHWCHVMAHESFEDEKIASILNHLLIIPKTLPGFYLRVSFCFYTLFFNTKIPFTQHIVHPCSARR